jgi:hypothetical protein
MLFVSISHLSFVLMQVLGWFLFHIDQPAHIKSTKPSHAYILLRKTVRFYLT